MTICYMYATFVQWWRLGALKTKLNGTLSPQNALLLCHPSGRVQKRCLENLLFQNGNRTACTVVPKQTINLGQWLLLPRDLKYFPIHFTRGGPFETPKLYILIQACLDIYKPHVAQLLQLEKFGDLVAWRVNENLEIIVKSDLNHLTRLLNCFTYNCLDMNHELSVLSVETIEVEGHPVKVKYLKKFNSKNKIKYSYAPGDWKKFIDSIKNLYSKLTESTNPKIMIENGTKGEEKKVPVSEVKPIKKSSNKNTLDVAAASGHKKHKSDDKKSRTTKVHKEAEKEVKIKITEDTEPIKEDATDGKIAEEVNKKKVQDESNTAIKAAGDVKTEKRKVEASHEIKKTYSEVAQARNLQRQDATRSKETSPNRVVKPPNILVYADSQVAKENVKSVLKNMINKEKYTVYDLPLNTKTNFWDTSTSLVTVCGNVEPDLTPHLLEYLLSGGQLLCLCSDLLYSVLQTYSTAEVRELELVRFSYGQWKNVKMMHHIFCYQASPAKKQFSKDSDQSNHSNGSSPVAPRTPSTVEIQHNSKNYTIQVQVLGAEETWQTPSLLLATVKGGSGKAIFSQVHLEVDPTQYQDDESKYSALRDSDTARLEILKDILSKQLEIDCRNSQDNIKYTPAYFLGRFETKKDLFSCTESIVNNTLSTDGIQVVFCNKDDDPGASTSTRLPVLIHSCPSRFSTVAYYEALRTKHLGRLMIYADVLTSSQRLLKEKLTHGLVVVARQQTEGKGRSNNEWLSPEGCAMFSLQLHVPLNSVLGNALPLLQHLVMVAIVSALKSIPEFKKMDLGLKWPNDLYAHSSIKIGGLVIASTVEEKQAVVNIGCGINLSNSEPTLCINDLITSLGVRKSLPLEDFLAIVFNEIERIYETVQEGNLDYLYELYYDHWLHNDAIITVSTNEGFSREVKVIGIDQYGYLKVKGDDGTISSVQPDGNSFDMLRGLIAPKIC